MFARRVVIKLKDGSADEVARILESGVTPPPHTQKGFRHLDTFISPELSEVVSNSYWDTEGNAEAYNLTAYPEMLKALANVLEGTPQVETFEISSSTFHKLTANSREAHRTSKLAGG
ncbi:MAG: hypothetical protein M3416_03475 [Acidobacteriota bacterium]|nr:hypothetical protein [Acidobacteriota bacterium]